MKELAVELIDVKKVIKGHTVLKNINLSLSKGQIYGLIGRNGSGKTMLMRMICGLIKPTSGTIKVWGKSTTGAYFPEDTAALIEHPGFLPQFTGRKNLKLLASIRGIISDNDIDRTLELLGLNPKLNLPVKKYSLGMRQRLGIAQALMENPKLLILDEPTNGLDSDGVEDVYVILKSLRSKGVTIILSSHNKEDISSMCDTVYKMVNGTLTEATIEQGAVSI
ncbi:ABC transporter ATP-binding protein [Paenibacillus sp. MMO-58]|uniref:ABC transporter ATP-binding protein n=1 Tax=Paenibacillus sp. MMO-58 TaxID=3081290 RepID=UPI003019C4AB